MTVLAAISEFLAGSWPSLFDFYVIGVLCYWVMLLLYPFWHTLVQRKDISELMPNGGGRPEPGEAGLFFFLLFAAALIWPGLFVVLGYRKAIIWANSRIRKSAFKREEERHAYRPPDNQEG